MKSTTMFDLGLFAALMLSMGFTIGVIFATGGGPQWLQTIFAR